MNTDEREIFHFLKTRGTEFVNSAEIARRVGIRKRFHKDPGWAKPILMGMEERGVLESDALGCFRIKPPSKKQNRWVAPDIAKILQESGVEVEGAGESATDDYYEQL